MRRVLCVVAMAVAIGSCQMRQEKASTVARRVDTTAFEFLMAVVNSLGRAHDAITSVNENPSAELVDRMTANQNASIALGMSQQEVARFAASPDSNVRAAASNIASAYEMMRQSLAIQLAGYEKMDSASSVKDLLGMKRQISNAKVAYQQGSALLAEATVLAFGACVVADPADTSRSALNLSSAEKARLLEALKTSFGPALTSAGGKETGPLQAARLLSQGLGQDWRLAR